MRKNSLLYRGFALTIVLFVLASFIPNILGSQMKRSYQTDSDFENVCELQENVIVTCYTFGLSGEPSREATIPLEKAEYLYSKICAVQMEMARYPRSNKAKQLQQEIIELADHYDLIPADLSKSKGNSFLSSGVPRINQKEMLPPIQNRASEFLCTFGSTGSGASLPIIILPRFIPILLTPIPRIFVRWNAREAMTSCGGLLSGTGFIAYGQQKGFALGFWGLGFTFSLPPLMGVYGLIGYALFATVNADVIEFYPPNNPPVISDENPPNWAYNVSTSLSELSFRIEDPDEDSMTYTVTTEPNIGSGSGINKKNGVYTVPISGLKSDELYIWTVKVTDGKVTTEKDFSFFTGDLPDYIVFFDNFNDNSINYSKWSEIYTNGTWEETNQRTEFQLYESGSGERFEGIESSEFILSLSPSKPIIVNCDMISDIGSTGWVGYLHFELTDGVNWICASYRKGTDDLQFSDSASQPETIMGNRPDGTWNNEIQICSDKYIVRMDSYDSGWVHHAIFTPNATLTVRIHIQVGGSQPSLYQRSGFDNVMVRTDSN